MQKIFLTIFTITFIFTSSIFPSSGSGQKLKVLKISETPKLDGKLNDVIWRDVPVFSEFRMVHPETGNDPTERTELKIA
ncbi:MAG: hypothetical protein KAR14_01395, partial [Candidatus Aminicenantes bacterium]|nr:hypothetical protein [Candidatus Aminicenantes bacterium]